MQTIQASIARSNYIAVDSTPPTTSRFALAAAALDLVDDAAAQLGGSDGGGWDPPSRLSLPMRVGG
jgi:hypothetical protein